MSDYSSALDDWKLRQEINKNLKDITYSVKTNYDEIKDNQDITFIVISADEKTLIKYIEAIVNVHEQYKDRNFNVVISSSYEKLHRLSRGVF